MDIDMPLHYLTENPWLTAHVADLRELALRPSKALCLRSIVMRLVSVADLAGSTCATTRQSAPRGPIAQALDLTCTTSPRSRALSLHSGMRLGRDV